MLEDSSYRNEDIYASIKELSKNKSTRYLKTFYKSRLYYTEKHNGEWSPKKFYSKKKFYY